MFRWTPEATREQKERVKAELGRLPALIPQVRAYHIGEDLGLVGGVNFDFALVADFDDLAGYLGLPGERGAPEDRRDLRPADRRRARRGPVRDLSPA